LNESTINKSSSFNAHWIILKICIIIKVWLANNSLNLILCVHSSIYILEFAEFSSSFSTSIELLLPPNISLFPCYSIPSSSTFRISEQWFPLILWFITSIKSIISYYAIFSLLYFKYSSIIVWNVWNANSFFID